MADVTPEPWEALKTYVREAGTTHDAFIESCYDEAVELVGNHVGGPAITEAQIATRTAALALVPTDVVTRAILECGSELYYRRNAPSGITQFATPDGQSAVRVARDPMVGAYPILAPYMAAGFA